MEAYTPLLWVVVLLLGMLSLAVLLLYLNQRNFQRVDYGHLIDQEELARRLNARLKHLEQLTGELSALQDRQRRDYEQLLDSAARQLALQIAEARRQIVDQVLERPVEMDFLLLRAAGAELADPPRPTLLPAPDASERGAARPSARQRQIAGLLEEGLGAGEVARLLGVSVTEVELVASMLFSARIA